jgi:hypothetical protein
LGDNVGIKVKRLTGVTSPVQGGQVNVPHGLIGDKIQGWLVKLVNVPNNGLSSEFDSTGTGYSYDCSHSSIDFIVNNHPTNSANILSKSFTILVFYIA